MMRSLLDAFWNEDVWLPPNTTWEDVAPGPDKAVVYADYRHLLYTVPSALMLLGLRHLLEMYWIAPFGEYLGIKNTRPKKAPYNPKLEVAYQNSSKIKHKQIAALANRLDLSERQVQRWWRHRRNQDKPSTLVKFCENMWRCTVYLINVSYGLFILWDKEWLWDIDYCYIGYPHQGISNDIWWYYMISYTYYVSLIMSQFWDIRRKDFWQMFVHHITVIVTMSLCWVCNLHRIVTLVTLSHDFSDVLLEAGKVIKYTKHQKLCDAIFILFTVVWIITRLGIYPFYLIWSFSSRAPMLIHVPASFYIIKSAAYPFLVLNIMWTWLILQTVYKTIITGRAGDVRSSCSELSDNSTHHSDHSTATRINHKKDT